MEKLTGILDLFITFTVALQAGNFGGLVSVLAAIGAAATVTVGLGMRDQVANLTADILIHLGNPLIKGDHIKVGDTEGRERRGFALNHYDSVIEEVLDDVEDETVAPMPEFDTCLLGDKAVLHDSRAVCNGEFEPRN